MKKNLLLILTFLILTTAAIAENVSNEAKLMYNHGLDLYKIGQHEKAIECFRKAIDISPDYIDAYYNLGTVLEFLKQDDQALVVFKQIIVRCPEDYESIYKAALLSVQLKDYTGAKKYLSIIPKDCPEGKDAAELAQKLNTPIAQPATKPINPNLLPARPYTLSSNIMAPTGIATDFSGNTYVASFADDSIIKITPSKQKILYSRSSLINGPIGLAMDENNNLYIANYNDNSIIKIAKTGIVSVLAKNILKPYGIHYRNRVLYITSQGSNSIIQYKLPD